MKFFLYDKVWFDSESLRFPGVDNNNKREETRMKKATGFCRLLSLFSVFVMAAVFSGCDDSGGSEESTLGNGLIHHYAFDGDAMDSGSDPKNGTIIGAEMVPDRDGNSDSACYFGGTDSISLEFYDFPVPSTISVWIKTTDTAGNIAHWWYEPSSPATDDLDVGVYDGKVTLMVKNGPSAADYSGSAVVNNDSWVHIAITSDGESITFYADGVSDGNFSLNPDVDSNSVVIGDNFSGTMDDLRIYNRVLNASEIEQLAQ